MHNKSLKETEAKKQTKRSPRQHGPQQNPQPQTRRKRQTQKWITKDIKTQQKTFYTGQTHIVIGTEKTQKKQQQKSRQSGTTDNTNHNKTCNPKHTEKDKRKNGSTTV